ncbi:hypothetical protein HZS_553 [Henneguya salminicola]|nr:hypothetical protein HZS_553 [Henneguya salminicola]
MDKIEYQTKKLGSLDLSFDAPSADMEPISLNYVANFDSNFEDNLAYSMGMNKFLEEVEMIKKMYVTVREGYDEHCSFLYTWRSISRALPNVADESSSKKRFYEEAYTILRKAIEPIFSFYNYIEKGQRQLNEIVTFLTKQDSLKDGLSKGLLEALGKMIDVFCLLDHVKNSKASLKNDLTMLKRIGVLTKSPSFTHEYSDMITNIVSYLIKPHTIMDSLKKSLENIPKSTTLIAQVISEYCDYIENSVFFTPSERFAILRTILACLYVIAGHKKLEKNLDRFKAGLSRIDLILRNNPAIGLTGDMHINTAHILKLMNLNFSWSLHDSIFLSKQLPKYNIVSYLYAFENEHIQIIVEFTQLLNSLPITIDENDAGVVYILVLKTLRLIEKWNKTLQEMFFFKLSHPADRAVSDENITLIDNYSLATRYNYDDQEKGAISRIIFFIKSTMDMLRKKQSIITTAINSHIYNVFQHFSNSILIDIQKKAIKSKCELFKIIARSIMIISSDKVEIIENSKNTKISTNYKLNNKSVPPLSSQLYMTRTMLNVLLTIKDIKKLLDSPIQQQIQAFLSESALFPALINFNETLLECSQMNIFWFREFYIEVSAGNCIQYSADDSFPGIITSYLSKSNETNFYEYILYIPGIYDDAAHHVLHSLKQRHLYDEIDAEARLVFDRLCYHLSEKLYSITRNEAFAVLFNKSVKNQISKRLAASDKALLLEPTIPFQGAHQIMNLCQQRSIQFLGRNLDFNSLLSQRLLNNLKNSLDLCIVYYENSPFENIVLLSALIDVHQQTHTILRRNFNLPDYKIILNEANGMIPGYLPRITNHVLISLLNNVAYNYSYCYQNERFIKSSILYTKEQLDRPKFQGHVLFGSKGMANGFEDFYSLYSNYIGIPHFEAVFKLIGYSGVGKIIEKIKSLINNLIDKKLKQCIEQIRILLPKRPILNSSSYGFTSLLELYDIAFQEITNFKDLKSGIFQHLRILGNYIIIIYLLEKAIYLNEGRTIYLTSPFDGVFGSSSKQEDKILQDSHITVVHFYKNLILKNISSIGDDQELKQMIEKTTNLHQDKLCCGLSIFSNLLKFLQSELDTPFWRGLQSNQNLSSNEENTELVRIFSIVGYILTIPIFITSLEFGDGILFGTLSILVILGEINRYEALDFCSHAVKIFDINSNTLIPLPSHTVSFVLLF